MAEKKRMSGLGRGLSALLEEASSPAAAASATRLSLADIVANPTQPRRQFTVEAMAELVASVKAHGVLQPILVRPVADGRYEIVAGERRWRASQTAGLHDIPALIKPLDDGQAFEFALIENIQRSDLNAMEEARGYRRLMTEFGHTQAAMADIIGKSRSHVANLLRLLDLPEAVQSLLEAGELSMGHARAVAAAADPVALSQRVIKEGLSVRATETLAAGSKTPRPRHALAAPAATSDANLEALELQLAEQIGMPVAVAMGGSASSGSLTVRFDSLDQLDWLCARLGG
ncbi:ParB family chromosome partitioning protein [Polymorphobacter multimanifer]|uniref:ParB family chromosome partitioning protein n=1 Tax=Polymorphobacter multimanifer TaxID=1070431 RepID=A0A841L3J9_9SPHN|nr:ParB/RepB/Spo0J family partition protein [Polymorphobacter multimanifer]MBB6227204.1 ParB family chromosome partitioning protein [Polymorphobacter multimanifer]